MTTSSVDATDVRARGAQTTPGRARPAPVDPDGDPVEAGPLRRGVERGMAATLAVTALLFVVLALPTWASDHRPGGTPLLLLSLCLAGSMVAALPLVLLRRPGPVRAGLWLPVVAYIGLLLVEPFTLRDDLPPGSTPWLLGLSLVAFSCTAVAEANPVRATAICVGLDVALAAVYAGRFPVSHTLVDLIGLGVLAGALIAGVRALRVRADGADAVERRARLLVEHHEQRVATEAERAHTDALLHDTVLAALLAGAAGDAPASTADMARSALAIVSDVDARPAAARPAVAFGEAVSAAERHLAPFRSLVRVDLVDARDVVLPPDVAEALVGAMLQAVTNSVRHAGADAERAAVAVRLPGGGVRVTVSDDGVGFDTAGVSAERLGVRVSVLERTVLAGGSADVVSAPGEGTVVTLEWRPGAAAAGRARRPGRALLELVPRRTLYRALGVLIVVAVLIASVEALVVTRAYGSVVASLLGLLILPALLRGARRGHTTDLSAWGTTAVSCLLCSVATIGLDPATFDCVSIARYTCGVLAGAVMGWMAGRRGPPVVAVTVLVVQMTLWAGPLGVIRLGLAAEIVIVVAGLLMHRAVRRVTATADDAARRHDELTTRQAELDAFHAERRGRLMRAQRTAAPLLRLIVDAEGELDAATKAECRLLEQSLRDEIRGRGLLNDAVRAVISAHRRRGALVQVLDDGGLEDLPPSALDELLDEVARQLRPVRSSRVVVRSGGPDSDTAVTIVALTTDETAAALGLEADDEVDLWVTLPHPGGVAPQPAVSASRPA
jgi:hypothetical protein